MAEDIAERLTDLIETKCLSRPLKVQVDDINYLKTTEGNYLFDLRGNMFKVGPPQLQQLQQNGLIYCIKRVGSHL